MLITHLLEDLQRRREEEIEFYLAEDTDGSEMIKLKIFICDGKYLCAKHDINGKIINNIIILGLIRAVDATSK